MAPSGGVSVMRFLTSAEVATFLRLGRSTVYEMSRRGELPSVVLRQGRGRSIRRWRACDIDAFIDAQLTGVPE